MKILIKVKTNAKEERVEKLDEVSFKVFVKALPAEGKANIEVVKTIARHYKIAPARVKIISGFKAKQKIIEIK